VKRPVRLVLTRMEDLAASNPAPPMRIRARLGAKKDGRLTALEAESLMDVGCYPSGWMGYHAAFMLSYYYRLPNYHVHSTEVLTFKQSVGSYRAPCGPSTAFALERLMDELARTLNIDPIELRLRNAIETGDPTPNNSQWPQIGMRQVLE